MYELETARGFFASSFLPVCLVVAGCVTQGSGAPTPPPGGTVSGGDGGGTPAGGGNPCGGGQGGGTPVAARGLWALDCDIRVRDANDTRDTLTVTYTPDTVNEKVTVTLRCTSDLTLHHPVLDAPAALAKDTDYEITLSDLKKNVVAELKITPGILPTSEDFATVGAPIDTVQTSTAKVYVTDYSDQSLFLWVSMNARATPFLLQVEDVDVVIQEAVASQKHVLRVDYAADAANEKLEVVVQSNKTVMLHHPNLASAAQLAANQDYTVLLSNIVAGGTAKIEISPSILAEEDCKTFGAQQSTDNGTVRVYAYAADAVVVWMSMNGRSTAFTVGAP